MTKTALITGSTSGIGKAFAEKLAYENYRLVLVSRSAEKLAAQAGAINEKYKCTIHTIPMDLSIPGAAQQVFDAVKQLDLNVQVLINNAGFNEAGRFSDTNMNKESEMIQLHAVYTTEMMKLFLPDMVANGYGRILNVGSTGSYIPCPYDAVYAATKAYILHVSKGINAELKWTGVSVTVLCPGSTKTEFAAKAGIEDTLLFKLFVMDAKKVAEIGYKAMQKGKSSVIAGIYNKLMVFSSKILPAAITNTLTMKMLKSRL